VKSTTGVVLSRAKITAKVDSTTYSATTSSTGSYLLSNLPLGTYNVTASANAYSSQTKSVDLTTTRNATVDFALAKKGKK